MSMRPEAYSLVPRLISSFHMRKSLGTRLPEAIPRLSSLHLSSSLFSFLPSSFPPFSLSLLSLHCSPLSPPLSSRNQKSSTLPHLLPQQTTLTIPHLPPPPLLLQLGPTTLTHSCSARRQNWHEKFESTITKLPYTYQKC